MTTDNERRRVAHNIRENYIRAGIGYRIASAYNIAMAIGIVPEILVEDIELWNRLADLIEPDKGRSADIGKTCDSDALLRLADELDARAVELLKLNDLDRSRQRRSARTDHAGDLIAACGRIREACGVEP